MVTEMITLKLERKFLGEVDITAKRGNYQNRTEFIRAALRDKVDEQKLKQTMQELAHLKGKYKKEKPTTDEDIEKGRDIAFEKLEKLSRSDLRALGF
ncbi:ribbon-helix-helix protein, CopG family [Candidatus Woesearchaeota archaeon]|nr:ribbon-helix-helix protein, CopG family [Candidatus Woesearchaeota archaeon]